MVTTDNKATIANKHKMIREEAEKIPNAHETPWGLGSRPGEANIAYA